MSEREKEKKIETEGNLVVDSTQSGFVMTSAVGVRPLHPLLFH